MVYVSSADGTNMNISLSDADAEATSSKTMGLTESAIAQGATGYVVTEGLLAGLDTSTATAGQSVWLSGTAGQFVFGAPPAEPAHSVYLGVVTRVQSINGEIFVKVQNGYEIDELHDVSAGSPSNGDLLIFNSSTGLWTKAAQSALTIAESQVTNLVSDLAGKASSTHTHGMTDLTGFTISSPTSGQTLTYNGTKWVNSAAPASGFDPFLLMGA